MSDLFSLQSVRYKNSFRAEVVLYAAEHGLQNAIDQYRIKEGTVRRWIQLYSYLSRDELQSVASGRYDSFDAFLETLEREAPYNHLLHHAAQCRLSGLDPLTYCGEYPEIDTDQFMDMYNRIKRIPLDQVEQLSTRRTQVTVINYENIIRNLKRSVTALFEGAQVPNPNPLMVKELKQMQALHADLGWAIGRFEECYSKLTPNTEPSPTPNENSTPTT